MSRVALVCLALGGTAATASAQEDRQGYYVGIEMGAVVGSPLGSIMNAVSHPTRCDRLLYPGSVAYPANDPACTDNTSREFLANQFDTGGGFAGGLVLGYAANVFRFEHVDTTAGRNIFGYQLLAGADYALTGNTSIGATLRWARFEGFEDEATWNLVRSHAPVIADGVTPFDSQLEFEDIGYQAVTVNLKSRF